MLIVIIVSGNLNSNYNFEVILQNTQRGFITETKKSTPVFCRQCNRNYKNIYILTRHLRYECGVERRFTCEICFRKFFHNFDKLKHMKKFHEDSQQIITKK